MGEVGEELRSDSFFPGLMKSFDDNNVHIWGSFPKPLKPSTIPANLNLEPSEDHPLISSH